MVRPPAMTTSAVGQLRDCLAIPVRDRCRIHSTLWRWPMFFRFSVAALAALCLSAPALTQQAIAQQPTVHDKSQDARIDELAKQRAVTQWVESSRTRNSLRAGEQLPVAVNIGTMRRELRGEGMRTWTITGPAYQLGVEIGPRPELTPPVAQAAGYFPMPRYA